MGFFGSINPLAKAQASGNTTLPTVPEAPPPVAPVAPTTPDPVTPPAAPTPPPAAPRPTFAGDLADATTIADNLLAGHEPAHVTDPHAADNAANLARLQARLGGLDSVEMLAAKEQGLASLDQSTAQNLERYGSIAGAHGVQGGAAAGLMGRALQENNQGRAQLERQLVLDNIAAKDAASTAYGNALAGQTRNGIDMSTTNTAADNAFTGLQISLPFDIMNGMGTYTAADDADAANNRALDIAEKAAGGDAPAAPTTTSSTGEAGRNELDTSAQTTITKIDSSIKSLTDSMGTSVGGNRGAYLPGEDIAKLVPMLREKIETMYPDEPTTEKSRIMQEELRKILFDTGIINTQGQPRTGQFVLDPNWFKF